MLCFPNKEGIQTYDVFIIKLLRIKWFLRKTWNNSKKRPTPIGAGLLMNLYNAIYELSVFYQVLPKQS